MVTWIKTFYLQGVWAKFVHLLYFINFNINILYISILWIINRTTLSSFSMGIGYNRPGVAYLSYKHNCDLKKSLTETHSFLVKSSKWLTARIVIFSYLNWSPNSIPPPYPPSKEFGRVSIINEANLSCQNQTIFLR